MVVVNRNEDKVNPIRQVLKDVDIVFILLSEVITCAIATDIIFSSITSEFPFPLFLEDEFSLI